MDSRKYVYRETGVILIGQAVCVGIMLGVYAMLGKFSLGAVLGGIVGALLGAGNFFLMAVGATLAADKAMDQDVKGGQALVRNSYLLRMAGLFVILFACAKSGLFDLFALVLPLIFVRPILTVAEFFKKKGDDPA